MSLLSRSSATALVVDDEQDNRDLVRELLEDCGIEVRTAASVRAALAIVASERIDVLVSDINMPELDGYGLIRALRALPDPAKASVPALAVTGLSKPEDRVRALRAGFDVQLTKPFDVNELVATVTALLERPTTKARSAENS